MGVELWKVLGEVYTDRHFYDGCVQQHTGRDYSDDWPAAMAAKRAFNDHLRNSKFPHLDRIELTELWRLLKNGDHRSWIERFQMVAGQVSDKLKIALGLMSIDEDVLHDAYTDAATLKDKYKFDYNQAEQADIAAVLNKGIVPVPPRSMDEKREVYDHITIPGDKAAWLLSRLSYCWSPPDCLMGLSFRPRMHLPRRAWFVTSIYHIS